MCNFYGSHALYIIYFAEGAHSIQQYRYRRLTHTHTHRERDSERERESERKLYAKSHASRHRKSTNKSYW